MKRIGKRATLGVVGLAALSAAALDASEVKLFRSQSQEALLQGTFDGVSVDPLGVLALGDQAARLATVAEPFVFAAAAHPRGVVVGTGNAGRVILVETSGAQSVLFLTAEPEVYALWVDADGGVYAGSSPQGKVYYLAPGAAAPAVLFDPKQSYIWALGRAAGGELLVATGTEGKLFAVTPGGIGRVLYDAEEPHLRSLAPLPGGGALVGTAGKGLVLELDPSGAARTVFDAAQPEVAALALGADGARYLAAVASEASLVDLTRAAEKPLDATGGGEKAEATVTASAEPVPAGSRTAGTSGARSEVVRLDPDGTSQTLWRFEQETVYAIAAPAGEGVWAATGQDGKVYAWRANQMVLEQDLEERQVVAVLPPARQQTRPRLVTTNGAAVYELRAAAARRGTYTSAALDAGRVARFGRLRFLATVPPGARLGWQARSGSSAEPDSTWSPWSAEQWHTSAAGPEVVLDAVPPGRYVQWRAIFEAGERRGEGYAPRVRSVELSYLQLNVRPEITRLSVLEAGQILVPTNFNPSNQVYEPASPNRDGIFTSLGPPAEEADPSRMKPLWKLGYRTLTWEGKDGNDDTLRYTISVAGEGAGDSWLELARDLERSYYAFDATVLPDGRYRFRVEASDEKANPPGSGLRAERTSESVVVDHSPPELVAVERSGERLEVRLRDALTPLREVVWSRGGAPWRPAAAGDSLVDSPSEVVAVPAPAAGGPYLLLRVTDAAYNVTTFDLSSHLR